ncbi:MAG: hypothetical protein WCQ49_02680 [Candidatus Saccharibacteria bacterium]
MDNKPTEQPTPISAPAPAPQVAAAPAPSTQGWPDQTPQPAQIQYVVAQQSLEGISGMLLFWIIVFSLNGLASIFTFFTSIVSLDNGGSVVSAIFAPLVAAACLASVVFIAMRKKIAIIASLVAAGVMILQSIVNTIVLTSAASSVVSSVSSDLDYMTGATSQVQSGIVSVAIGTIVASLVYGGLVALYFFTSKRVKQTLIK